MVVLLTIVATNIVNYRRSGKEVWSSNLFVAPTKSEQNLGLLEACGRWTANRGGLQSDTTKCEPKL